MSARLRKVLARAELTIEEIGSIISALQIFEEQLVGESPYIDALRSGLAKLKAIAERGNDERPL